METALNPLLIEVPTRIVTERLILRRPLAGDGAVLNDAVRGTLEELRPWMPWAQAAPTLEESEAWCRRQQAKFELREDLPMFVFERTSDGEEGSFVGCIGLHRMDWALRRFEIGYWRRSAHAGRGVITEAVKALARSAFDALAARRVEIRMDADNERSRRVAERAGFTFEGVLRSDSLTPSGEARDTRVYARVRGIEESVKH